MNLLIPFIQVKESHLIRLDKNEFTFSARAKDRWSLLHAYAEYYVICKSQTRPTETPINAELNFWIEVVSRREKKKTKADRRTGIIRDNMGR